MEISKIKQNLLDQIKKLLSYSRNKVLQTVNTTMVYTYFEIGRLIVEDEQSGYAKAKYGEKTLENLSMELAKEFGKGFSVRNLKNMRQFYIIYSNRQTLSAKFNNSKDETIIFDSKLITQNNFPKFKLSWSHYVVLIQLDTKERTFYETETLQNNWSIRELKRQYNSALFERIVLSKNKKKLSSTVFEKGKPNNFLLLFI